MEEATLARDCGGKGRISIGRERGVGRRAVHFQHGEDKWREEKMEKS